MKLLIFIYLDPICTFYLEKGPENMLGTSDDDLTERNPLWKKNLFQEELL